jgi:hypothetical protein
LAETRRVKSLTPTILHFYPFFSFVDVCSIGVFSSQSPALSLNDVFCRADRKQQYKSSPVFIGAGSDPLITVLSAYAVKYNSFVGGTQKPQRSSSMKKNRIFILGMLAVLLTFGLTVTGCDNVNNTEETASAKTGRAEEILATLTGYTDYTAEAWQEWIEQQWNNSNPNEIPADVLALSIYMDDHLDELTSEGAVWWQKTIGTDVVVQVTDSTVGGVTYSTKVPKENNRGTHYLLFETTYDAALAAFTELFELPPWDVYNVNLQQGSSLSNGTDWVIFEDDTTSYRLVKDEGGIQTGVTWNKRSF